MSIARQVAKAEAVADVSVISALRDISDQLGRAEKEGLRLIPIKATCPWVLDAIWKIASGRVPLEQGSTSIAQGLVTDRANLMNRVISFGNEF